MVHGWKQNPHFLRCEIREEVMSQGKACVRFCRGLISCQWKKSNNRENNKKHTCCLFSAVMPISLFALLWLYFWMVSFNDRDDVNWEIFTKLHWWVNWFMVVVIISAVFTSYCILLLLFVLVQVALEEDFKLHLLHKFLLFLGVIFITFMVTGVCLVWKQELPIISLSLQATAPFLQFGAVGALTLLSPFIFQAFFNAKHECSKFLVAAVFLVVTSVIFMWPLFIHSPCLIEPSQLPDKPKFFGHRGSPMGAPENTMMSFERSIECNVTAFETDVQLSKDRVPFLMHDHESEFLLRTTNVREQFRGKKFNHSTDLTWEELQRLNAGEWFVKTDPFHTVSQLSEEEKERARNQTIPSLLQLLKLAMQHNISVIFDLKSPDQENGTNDTQFHNSSSHKNDINDIVTTILNSGIDPSLILWLPSQERPLSQGFIQIFDNENDMIENSGNHLNVRYSKFSTEKIRDLRSKKVTVNLWVVNERWLFSLLWCAGASSVTTNSCHLLKDLDHPDWVMARPRYAIIWISVNILSLVIMTGLSIFQWKRQLRYVTEKRGETTSTSEREIIAFLGKTLLQ